MKKSKLYDYVAVKIDDPLIVISIREKDHGSAFKALAAKLKHEGDPYLLTGKYYLKRWLAAKPHDIRKLEDAVP